MSNPFVAAAEKHSKQVTEADGDRTYTFVDGEMAEKWPAKGKLKTGEARSVTTILNVLDKSKFLVPWAARVEAEAWEDGVRQTLIASRPNFKDESIETFIGSVVSVIGPTRAHVKQKNKACDIGSAAHALIEARLKGQENSVPAGAPEALAFLGWCAWANSVKLEPLHIEKRVWSVRHRYAGTVDFIGTYLHEGVRRLGVFDWKSSAAVYDSALMQVAAYIEAGREMGLFDDRSFREALLMGLDLVIVRLPKSEDDPLLKTDCPVEVVRKEPHEYQPYLSAFLAANRLREALDDIDVAVKAAKKEKKNAAKGK